MNHTSSKGRQVTESSSINEPEAERAYKEEKLDGLKVANLLDDTNFTIRLGKHSWKVQAEVMTEQSGFFRAMCNGGFQESIMREVELHDDNVWDFARLLQFIYTGGFDGGPISCDSSMSLTMMDLIKQDIFPAQQDIHQDANRDKSEVQSAVFKLAAKYDKPRLRETIAQSKISEVTKSVKRGSGLWRDHSGDYYALFLANIELIEDFSAESETMLDLETHMAYSLVACQIKEYRYNNRPISMLYMAAALLDEKESATSEYDIFCYRVLHLMGCNSRFAQKYAMALECTLGKALTSNKWSTRKLEDLSPVIWCGDVA